LFQFLRRELFNPLGFTAPAWAVCPNGHAMGATGMFCSVKDMIKLGVLYANGGTWKGQRIISEEWIKEASLPHAAGWYGYSFRMNGDAPWYGCGGMFGQKMFIPREKGKAVIAWSAYDADEDSDSTDVLIPMIDEYYRS